MKGDSPDIRELQVQMKEIKDQHIELRQDVKAMRSDINQRLTSIDSSLSALAPIIASHTERFKTMDTKIAMVEKAHDGLSGKLWAMGLTLAGTILTLGGSILFFFFRKSV